MAPNAVPDGASGQFTGVAKTVKLANAINATHARWAIKIQGSRISSQTGQSEIESRTGAPKAKRLQNALEAF
ncbi:MAG: hypothetical protein KDI37_11770 [Xanthomonadales bacterium]|nr:hypothetical protein [Xanthomonadales bacterium]